MRPCRPGTTSPAGATVTASGWAVSIRSTAARLAASMRSPWLPNRRTSMATAAGSPPAGGRQSTSTASAPCARTASPKPARPTLTAAIRVRTSSATPAPAAVMK